jgi:hypothetical protein
MPFETHLRRADVRYAANNDQEMKEQRLVEKGH